MPFAAALSVNPDTPGAVAEVLAGARLPEPPDLALLFFSPHHADGVNRFVEEIHRTLQPRCLLGCVGESIVGNDREVEGRPAASLWLAQWPKAVEIEPFHLELETTPDGHSLLGWPDGLMTAGPAEATVLLLSDPTTFPIDLFLSRMNADHRGVRVIGGMASGMRRRGECRLVLRDQIHTSGAVGVLLRGDIGLRSIVSQGCRPIGRTFVVTRVDQDRILELGGRPVLQQLQQMWQELTPEDQDLFRQGLHIGIVMNEYRGDFQRGDFLVRNVLGIDRDSGSLVITDRLRVGQTVQFHVRDAQTADEDLKAMLQMDLAAHEHPPKAALVFSCNGRGTRMFLDPHHDARTIRGEAGELPLAGFFAAGELGPVGEQNFIHGFTASVALFE